MRKDILDFLSALEGYHSTLKMIHWSASNNSEHVLTDKIDETVLEYEDKISEISMGLLNTRFGIGDLKCMLPQSKELKGLLDELESDILSLRKKLTNDKCCGLVSTLDDMMKDIDTFKYLRTLS